jgi:hypothetical protein
VNYFAHGRHCIERPYLLAGTAVPDWLSVVDRRARARSRAARPFLQARDQRLVDLAAGVLKHHADDDWFHGTRAFAELNWEFTVAIRDRLPPDDGLRPSFLGHILVELLLDAELIAEAPSRLDDYYAAMRKLDPEYVAWGIQRMTSRPIDRLPHWIERFSSERFLYDYGEDAKLLVRLNMVMRRVGLPPIPEELQQWFPEARQRVRPRIAELLAGEDKELVE